MNEKAREQKARRQLRKLGYALRKDRARSYSAHHLGGYMIFDPAIGGIVAGGDYDLSLDDVEAFI